MGQTGARSVHAVGGGDSVFTGLPLGEGRWPRSREGAQHVVADAVDLVGGEDAEETGDDGKARFVVGEKGAGKSQGARGKRVEGYGRAVVQGLQEVCDAAGRVGEGEDGAALDGGCGVDGGDEVAEDVGVADEEALVDDEIVGAGEDDDVPVAKGEIRVSDEGHDQVSVGTCPRRPSNSIPFPRLLVQHIPHG